MFWMFAPDAFVTARKRAGQLWLKTFGTPSTSRIVYKICSTFMCGPTDILVEFKDMQSES